VRLALGSEQLQAELNRRLEALAAQRGAKDGGAGDEESEDEGLPAAAAPPPAGGLPSGVAAAFAASTHPTPAASAQLGGGGGAGAVADDAATAARAGSQAPAASAATAASSEAMPGAAALWAPSDALLRPPPPADAGDWAAWMAAQRLGLRRALGADLRGRRYWCLGREAGAFRVYVEEEEGRLWGWYEGAARGAGAGQPLWVHSLGQPQPVHGVREVLCCGVCSGSGGRSAALRSVHSALLPQDAAPLPTQPPNSPPLNFMCPQLYVPTQFSHPLVLLQATRSRG
jgi:hypothetical protein